MKINLFIKAFLVTLVLIFAVSCDKDYNEIGTNIVGGDNDHYGFEKSNTSTVLAYNQNTGVVQTNNLPINTLGYYNDPVFGKTTANFVAQLELGTANPQFINTDNAGFEIDSVYLYIPYYNKLVSTNADTGDKTYTLDSIYNQDKKIKLSVYESGYYLRDFDATTGFQEAQKYYSNQNVDFDAAKIGTRLNDTVNDTSQNENFIFKKDEIKLTYTKDGEVKVKERKTPGIWLTLNRSFFMNKIVNAPAGTLTNNNTFKEYFRGLYFKVEPNASSPDDGAMAKIDFSKGVITMVYHDETSTTDTTIKRKTLDFNLKGNTVNVFENQYNSSYTSIINTPNTTQGDEKLYLKGGEGSMAVIQLFGTDDVNSNGISDEIDQIKSDGWLINEANLTFYIDNNTMATTEEPNRIYLYDLENRRPLLDYYSDVTTLSSNAKFNKYVHGGIIEKEDVENGRGIKYKIRITEHVRNLINNDSTNVKLGLVVTESIANVTNSKLKNQITNRLDRIPVASVINPLGTVLYGSNSNVPDDKRLKLEIYYTKPD